MDPLLNILGIICTVAGAVALDAGALTLACLLALAAVGILVKS